MLELFRTIPPVAISVSHPPTWPTIKLGIQRNVKRVQQYCYVYPRPVKPNHFLIRLLASIAVPRSLSLERYYANVDTIALNVSMAMRMTSPVYRGSLFRGVFYGPTTPEILIATDDRFDFEDVHKNWQQANAVTVLLHAKTDMSIGVPTGAQTSAEDGLAVMLINVPMLAVQYRAFLLAQANVVAAQTPMHFIGGYVLPNMLRTHMELCLFNRLRTVFLGRRPVYAAAGVKHPFALPSYEPQLQSAIEFTLARNPPTLLAALASMPSFYNTNLHQSLLMPDMAPTRQCDWALVLTRLQALDFLFRAMRVTSGNKGQLFVNQAQMALRSSDVHTLLRETLPPELFFEAQGYIDNVLLGIH